MTFLKTPGILYVNQVVGKGWRGRKAGRGKTRKGAPIYLSSNISLGVIDIIATEVVTHLANTAKDQRSTRSMFHSFCLSFILNFYFYFLVLVIF